MFFRFAEKLDELIAEGRGAGIDGLNLADILQQAATKMMKECLGGDAHQRDDACFELLDGAREELAEARRAKQRSAS
jgi:hypothetical protein